jgi:hypothetical protein
MDLIMEILSSWGIPTALTGLFFWKLKRDLTKKDQAREERERNREELDLVILKSTTAALSLGEATAKAVQRIPEAHCNGDMHSALAYVAQVKFEQKDFLTKLGIHALHEE